MVGIWFFLERSQDHRIGSRYYNSHIDWVEGKDLFHYYRPTYSLILFIKATMKPYQNAKIYSIAANPNDSNAIEAASIVYHDGYYYLFASIDKCCSGTFS